MPMTAQQLADMRATCKVVEDNCANGGNHVAIDLLDIARRCFNSDSDQEVFYGFAVLSMAQVLSTGGGPMAMLFTTHVQTFAARLKAAVTFNSVVASQLPK